MNKLEKIPEYSAYTDPEVDAALRDEVAMRCFADSIEMNPPGISRGEWYGRWARESYAAADAFIEERQRRYGKEK